MSVTVGIRELKAELSRYVREARSGETVVITDHGTPVAELRPIGGDSVFERLLAEGLITAPTAAKTDAFPPPIPARGTVSDLVADQRR